MTILQLRFNKASLPNGYIAVDKGNTTPAWFTNNLNASTGSKSNWYRDTTPSPKTPDIFVNNRQSDLTTMFQYGQDIPTYATAKFFNWRYEIQNEKVATDGTVTATIVIHIGPTYSKHAQPSGAGLPVIESMTVAGTQVFAFTGHTIDEFGQAPNPTTVTKQVKIPARTEAQGLDAIFKVHYTDNSHPDVNLTLGTRLFNPSVSLYTPMMLKGDDGKWKILNDINKAIRVKKDDGTWATVRQEPLADQDKVKPNANHVYKTAEGWRQMPLPEGNTH